MSQKQFTKIFTALMVVLIFLFSFQQKPEHQYIVQADYPTWAYITNYIAKTQVILQKTSTLPANEVFALSDTLGKINDMFIRAVSEQKRLTDSTDKVKKP